jgi:hypothetical protein
MILLRKKMILSRKRNNFLTEYFNGIRIEPYLKINLVLTGVILLLFVYSGIFSPDKNNYPVVCIYEKITGEQCFSCGLSHSISLIIRGRFEEAYRWNIYGMRVFLFFFSQLLMRVIFSVYFLRDIDNRKWLIKFDIVGSALIFAIVFYPFFKQLFIAVFNS